MYPDTITTGADITAYYVKTPTDPRWGYSVGALGQYVYDSTAYGDNLLNNGGVLSSILTNPTGIAPDKTYTGLTTTVSPAGGSGAVLSEVVSGGTVTSVTVTTPGSGYSVDDVITVSSGQFTGAPTSDLDITLTAADFNSGSTYGSTGFELHPSEQPNIIMNILMYCGVVIRDPQIVQNAAQMIAQDEALEKS